MRDPPGRPEPRHLLDARKHAPRVEGEEIGPPQEVAVRRHVGHVQGPREGSFGAFPSIQAHRRHSSEEAPNSIAEYRFWFAYEKQGEDEPSKPLVAFETTGHAWKPGEDAGERFDFVRMYDTVGRDFDRLMAAFDTWRAAW